MTQEVARKRRLLQAEHDSLMSYLYGISPTASSYKTIQRKLESIRNQLHEME